MSDYIDLDELRAFRLEYCPGVAWHAIAYEPMYDEYGDEDGYTTDTIIAVMVGDNRRFRIPTEDCIPITNDEYCSQCGQIGCGHG